MIGILPVFFSHTMPFYQPYEVGEEVLVESKSRLLFWDASVTGVCRRALTQDSAPMIDGYRVQYTGWTSHYTEWVEPDRVVEPNENNKLLQVRHSGETRSLASSH